MGGGLEVVFVCDIIVVVEYVEMVLLEVKVGFFVGVGGIQCLMCQIGIKKVMEMLFIGWVIGVEEVLVVGLINYVVFYCELIGKVMELVC